jgi:small glutamine-rich tetratricopeptide repeat-containing protein alpha
MKTGLQNSEARIASDGDVAPPRESSSSNSPPRAGAGAGGLGGAGAGGMPDLASMMNNPAMMQMAQQMMANGGMERLMSNPAVANMVGCMKSYACLTYIASCLDGSPEQRRWNAIHG